MQIKEFLKDKVLFVALNVIIAMFSAFLLYMVDAQLFLMLFIPCTYLLGCIIILLIEFIIKYNFYKKLYHSLEHLDKKCLLSEIIEEPSFYEGKILYDLLKISNKSMNDEISKYHLVSSEYREYIELWVHEIKTPIAGARLICENSENHTLIDTLNRIDKFVEQALFYSRSNTVEKDFLIKKINLKELVNGVLRKNAKHLIESKISIELENLDSLVFTDVKWVDFILQQILDNAVKYKSNHIKIYAIKNASSISLYISDDGIGIPLQDISRVFDKGFTGENGRKYAKSTGIGLYLCKKLCLKLGMNIAIKSKQNQGTTVEIIFPKSDMFV